MALGLKAWFACLPFALVLTSPMRCARATCDLSGFGAHAGISADLSEWDYGDYEGRRTSEISAHAPGWNLFRDGCPRGESPAQVSERADRLIAGLLAVTGNIALFSHGQFGCALGARWVGLEVVEGQHLALDTGSVSILGPKTGQPDIPVITQWNGGPRAQHPQSQKDRR